LDQSFKLVDKTDLEPGETSSWARDFCR
jgi:hypothetical protein